MHFPQAHWEAGCVCTEKKSINMRSHELAKDVKIIFDFVRTGPHDTRLITRGTRIAPR